MKQLRRVKLNKRAADEARATASSQLYAEVQQIVANRDAERVALRRIEVTGGDETALGCKSSGWPEYKVVLSKRLRDLAASKITKADQSAKVFNNMGFKTGSGQIWTPRLINVAKYLLFGLMNDRIVK